MNVQFAIADESVYVLEVNPRASRTVPFVSKAIGLPIAQLAARVMAGKIAGRARLHERESCPSHVSVKEAVFPFVKFPGVDTLLGPEMKSTGEVMGIDREFGRAYAKAQRGAGMDLPTRGTVLVSLRDEDKAAARRRAARARRKRASSWSPRTGTARRSCASAGSTCSRSTRCATGSRTPGTLIAGGRGRAW